MCFFLRLETSFFLSSWNAVTVFCCKQNHPATEAFICSCMDVMEMFFFMGVIRGGSGFFSHKNPLVTLIKSDKQAVWIWTTSAVLIRQWSVFLLKRVGKFIFQTLYFFSQENTVYDDAHFFLYSDDSNQLAKSKEYILNKRLSVMNFVVYFICMKVLFFHS